MTETELNLRGNTVVADKFRGLFEGPGIGEGSGTTWHFGETDPSAGLGDDGDFYLQTGMGSVGVLGDVWEKSDGDWTIIVNLRGTAGEGDGDVVGPDGGVTEGHAVVWNGTTGKLIKTAGFSPADATHTHILADITDSGTMASEDAADYTPTAGLADVALTGSYNDLEDTPTLVEEFLDLGDTPDSYDIHTGKYVRVNSTADGLEFQELGDAAVLDVGTTEGTVAAGDHDHDGVYEPADGDLSAIAALTPVNDDFIQRKSGAWTNRTPAEIAADLAHSNLQDVGTNTHTQIDTHIADAGKHREINDSGSAVTDLWSADKIGTELAAKADEDFSTHSEKTTPVGADTLLLNDSEDGGAAKRVTKTNLQSGLVPDSREVATQHSLTGGGDLSANRTLNLVGDTASPGSDKYYGTDASGKRGFFDLPAGNGGDGGVVLSAMREYTPSGSPHTWNKPSGLAYIVVIVVGGGGGGSEGSSSGGSSSFGAHCSATGGEGLDQATNSGGSGVGGDLNFNGQDGVQKVLNFYQSGGAAGGPWGGAGGPGTSEAGQVPGGGGTGHPHQSSNDRRTHGGGGGSAIKRITEDALGATETVTVGSGGSSGTAGGAGGAGRVFVFEYTTEA